MSRIDTVLKIGGTAANASYGALAAGTAAATGGVSILVGLAISVGVQIIGHLLKPRKKTPPQEILPWQTITAERGGTVALAFGTPIIENTMVLGVYNEAIETVPAPKSSNKKAG